MVLSVPLTGASHHLSSSPPMSSTSEQLLKIQMFLLVMFRIGPVLQIPTVRVPVQVIAIWSSDCCNNPSSLPPTSNLHLPPPTQPPFIPHCGKSDRAFSWWKTLSWLPSIFSSLSQGSKRHQHFLSLKAVRGLLNFHFQSITQLSKYFLLKTGPPKVT